MKSTAMTLMLTLCAAVGSMAAESRGTIDQVSGKSCATCHRSKVTGQNVHEAVAARECTPCHNATGGDHQKNHTLYAVKDKSAKLCYECHDNRSSQKSVHPTIEVDGCLGCHAPHTSPLIRLLRSEVPGLCFQCHDRGLVEQKETGTATGFRDGVQNLHYLHAGERNAIACLTCHDVHASAQLHLIKPKGRSATELVTTTYTASGKGGNCTTSCHDALGYERK